MSADLSRRVERHLCRRGIESGLTIESARQSGTAPIFPGLVLTVLRPVGAGRLPDGLRNAARTMPGRAHYHVTSHQEAHLYWDDTHGGNES